MTPPAQKLYDENVADDGYVSNGSRLWAYQPETKTHLFDLMSEAFEPRGLSFRQRGILVAAIAARGRHRRQLRPSLPGTAATRAAAAPHLLAAAAAVAGWQSPPGAPVAQAALPQHGRPTEFPITVRERTEEATP